MWPTASPTRRSERSRRGGRARVKSVSHFELSPLAAKSDAAPDNIVRKGAIFKENRYAAAAEAAAELVEDGMAVGLGTGTTVEVNGKNKGTLGGKAVADAILNTWIGAKPGPGGDFKKGVLGL